MLALAKLVEQLLSVRYQGGGLLEDCFVALIEASLRLKAVQEEDEEEDENVETEDEDDEDDSDGVYSRSEWLLSPFWPCLPF